MTGLQNRIAEETDADAVLIPGRITHWNNILIPLRDARNADRIVEFLDAFDPETVFALEVFHATTDGSDVEAAQEMLDGVKRMLLERGFTESDLETTVAVATDPEAAIIDRANKHNVVVIGETEVRPDSTRFLGPIYERITEGSDVPVVVVRNQG
jgi:nucleotide-binding universal stress UspA family protein